MHNVQAKFSLCVTDTPTHSHRVLHTQGLSILLCCRLWFLARNAKCLTVWHVNGTKYLPKFYFCSALYCIHLLTSMPELMQGACIRECWRHACSGDCHSRHFPQTWRARLYWAHSLILQLKSFFVLIIATLSLALCVCESCGNLHTLHSHRYRKPAWEIFMHKEMISALVEKMSFILRFVKHCSFIPK